MKYQIPTRDSGSGVLVPTYTELTRQAAAPAAPAAGKTRLYVDTNGVFQLLPDTGPADQLAKASDVAAARRWAYSNSQLAGNTYTLALGDEHQVLGNYNAT
ncbi:MAG TPA: hypothetical protein VFH45_06185, partial [Acidimicrobiales bacterium]|nr:hypothetical protein [Acidimicrobiales bacterium]